MCLTRTVIAIWGPPEPLSRFTKELIEKGWEAHAPNNEEDFGYLAPAFRIFTTDGIFNVGNVVGRQPPGVPANTFFFIPMFRYTTVEAQVAAQLHDLDDYPGLQGPDKADSLAALIADSDQAPPRKWASDVIDKYYDAGLRFCFQTYDPCDGPEAYCRVLYSAPSWDTDFKLDHSRHCCGVVCEGDLE